MSIPNEKHKDSVFTDLFQNNPENFLSLYNAIHCTDFKLDEVKLESERFNQSLYKSYRIYEKIIPNRRRYQKNLSFIPTPEFYVFYNGLEPYPDERELKLSDAFASETDNIQLELKVIVFNINNPTTEKSLNILNKCVILKQYCECIDIIRHYYKKDDPKTYDEAIKECIKKGVLGNYLEKNCKEKFNMFVHDYDYETDIQVQREESFEAGQKNGEKKKAIETAKAFLREGDSVDKVARCINLPLEEVQKLSEEIKNNA